MAEMRGENRMKELYIASCCPDGGIYHCRLEDGRVEQLDFTPCDRPMYLAVSGRILYALLREPFQGSSGLIKYEIRKDGSLKQADDVVSTHGKCACHLAVEGDDIYCVNYLSGNVVLLPDQIAAHTGKGVHPKRQEAPHTHFVCVTPDKNYVLVTDLGTDRIVTYNRKLNRISETKLPDGKGPRHLAFSEDGTIVFCVNELSSDVSVLNYRDGKLSLCKTFSALPADFCGESTAAAIRVYKGKVYVSNRGHDSITCFDICGKELVFQQCVPCGGQSPRDFDIIGEHIICTNENSDNVTLFELNPLRQCGNEIKIKAPLCVIERKDGNETI